MSELKEIKDKLEQLKEEVESISVKLDKVMELLNINHEECARMGNHITFVESIYDSVERPLNFICDKITNYADSNIGLIEEE
jgi:archaellum component FlaC